MNNLHDCISVIIKNNKYSSTSHFHTKEFEWIKWLLQISNRMLPNYVRMSIFLPLEQPRSLDFSELQFFPYILSTDAKCVSRQPAPGKTYGCLSVSCNAMMDAWQTVLSSSREVSSGAHSTRVHTGDDFNDG